MVDEPARQASLTIEEKIGEADASPTQDKSVAANSTAIPLSGGPDAKGEGASEGK